MELGHVQDGEFVSESAATQKRLLDALMRSEAWREVVKPALEVWMARLERRLATDACLSEEMLRYVQGQHNVLRTLQDKPMHLLDVLKRGKT
jgi:hypothetical protein